MAELIHLPLDHAANRFRQLALDVRHRAGERPAIAFLNDHSAVAQVAKQIHHEERIALGSRVEKCHEFFGQLVPGERQRQVAGEVVAAQERQGDLAADASPLKVKLDGSKRMLAERQVGRAIREHHQQSQSCALGSEVGQEIHARGIGPVDIIEEDDHRASPRELVKEHGELAFSPLLRSSSGIFHHPCESRLFHGKRHQLHIPCRGHDFHDLGRSRAPGPLRQAVERLQNRQERFGAGQPFGASPPRQAVGAVADGKVVEEAFDQRGLAKAWLAGHADDQAATSQGRLKAAAKRCAFHGAADRNQTLGTNRPILGRDVPHLGHRRNGCVDLGRRRSESMILRQHGLDQRVEPCGRLRIEAADR